MSLRDTLSEDQVKQLHEVCLATVDMGGEVIVGEFCLSNYWNDTYEVIIYRAHDSDGCGVESVNFIDCFNYMLGTTNNFTINDVVSVRFEGKQ